MSVPNEQMVNGFEPTSELPARRRVGLVDVLWALAMLVAAGIGYSQYSASLDYYATGTLFGAALGLGFLG